jgi:TPR repeat protein
MKPKREDPFEIDQKYFYRSLRKKNYRKAFPYLLESIRNVDDKAPYNLAIAYLNGEYIQQNKHYVHIWLEKAAKRGNKRALKTNVDDAKS